MVREAAHKGKGHNGRDRGRRRPFRLAGHRNALRAYDARVKEAERQWRKARMDARD